MTTFVLAAIVGPAEFGVMALALIYIGFIDMILQQGFVGAIIQRKVLRQSHVTSIFWLLIAFSGVLSGAGVLLGPYWAGAYRTPVLASVIPVLSLAIPLGALGLVPTALLTRHFRIRALTVRSVASAAISSALAIPLALAGFGVWSLVAMHLSYITTSTILVLAAARWRPTFEFRWAAARQLLPFSLSNFAARAGDFVVSQTDAIVIGLFWGPTAVGIYRLAARLVTMALEFLSGPLQFVSFPEFSKLQNNLDRLRHSLLAYTGFATILTWPFLVVLALAGPYIPRLMGNKWAGVEYALAPLVVYGALATLTDFLGPLLKSVGRPGTLAAIVWTQGALAALAFAMVGSHFAGATLPIQAASIGGAKAALYILVPLPSLLYFGRSLLGLPVRRVAGALRDAAVCASGVLLVGWTVRYGLQLAGWNAILQVVCMLTAAGTTWVLCALALSANIRQLLSDAARQFGVARPLR